MFIKSRKRFQKQVLSLLLVVALVLTGLPLTARKAQAADGTAKVSQTTKVSGKPGDTVTVPVAVENNQNLTGFQLLVSYDASVLKALATTQGEVIEQGNGNYSDSASAGNNPFKILWGGVKPVSGDGAIVNLNFEILDTAGAGDTTITVGLDTDSAGEPDPDNFFDEEEENIAVEFDLFSVTVEGSDSPAETETPDEPAEPEETAATVETTEPDEPITPIETDEPYEPIIPVETDEPVEPITPVETVRPVDPITPVETDSPAEPERPDEGTAKFFVTLGYANKDRTESFFTEDSKERMLVTGDGEYTIRHTIEKSSSDISTLTLDTQISSGDLKIVPDELSVGGKTYWVMDYAIVEEEGNYRVNIRNPYYNDGFDGFWGDEIPVEAGDILALTFNVSNSDGILSDEDFSVPSQTATPDDGIGLDDPEDPGVTPEPSTPEDPSETGIDYPEVTAIPTVPDDPTTNPSDPTDSEATAEPSIPEEPYEEPDVTPLPGGDVTPIVSSRPGSDVPPASSSRPDSGERPVTTRQPSSTASAGGDSGMSDPTARATNRPGTSSTAGPGTQGTNSQTSSTGAIQGGNNGTGNANNTGNAGNAGNTGNTNNTTNTGTTNTGNTTSTGTTSSSSGKSSTSKDDSEEDEESTSLEDSKCKIKKAKYLSKKKVKVTWAKLKGAGSYQIQCSKKRSFAGAKKFSASGTSKTVKLSKGIWFVRVRGCKGGKYSKWSAVRSVKVKK